MTTQRKWLALAIAAAMGMALLGCEPSDSMRNAKAPTNVTEPPPAAASTEEPNTTIAAVKPEDTTPAPDPRADNPVMTASPNDSSAVGPGGSLLPPATNGAMPDATLPPAVNMATPPATTPIPNSAAVDPTKSPSEK